MNSRTPSIILENGLHLRDVLTTGSVLQISESVYDNDFNYETEKSDNRPIDFIGQPIKCFDSLEKTLTPIDVDGFVKKRVLEEGGGMPLQTSCTVFIAYSGFWENEIEPFDVVRLYKPMEVDLKDNGLLPGLQMAVLSMLVGEMSLFMLSHQVMYGELGIPPRIKPKAKCVFYIKLVKSVITPKDGKINYSEPNSFERVIHEVRLLHSSAVVMSKNKNYAGAIPLLKRGVNMLHRCRLADETEEKIQEKTLIKLYSNLAICYNKIKTPLKACTACNELNRLNSLWNNGKNLFQNAKALRMIGQFDRAEERLKKAMKLYPTSEEMKEEYQVLQKLKISCNQSKLLMEKVLKRDFISEQFKHEVEKLIKNFKEDPDLCSLALPNDLNSSELSYFKEICIREHLYLNKMSPIYEDSQEETSNVSYLLDKDIQNNYGSSNFLCDDLGDGMYDMNLNEVNYD